MTDNETERYYQAQLDRLRAELAVPACSGDCQNCPLNTTVTNETDGQSTTATTTEH